LFRTGKVIKKPTFQAVYDFQGRNFQFGVLVPKRIAAKATTRNVLRRTITAALPRQFVDFNKLRLAIKLTSGQVTQVDQPTWRAFFEDLLATLKNND
jgi:RNase P protein component